MRTSFLNVLQKKDQTFCIPNIYCHRRTLLRYLPVLYTNRRMFFGNSGSRRGIPEVGFSDSIIGIIENYQRPFSLVKSMFFVL